jgi:cellulose synthase/poly-beta-1,6-N-acetylglucosamine synthase-like glycosyltransferase
MQISFVVPAYNEEALIAGCLQAIKREVCDVGCDAEIIVVNNASTDATHEVVSSIPGVTVIDEPIKGLVQARRTGFLASSGELVANIDADTMVTEGWLRIALAEFARTPNLVALSGPHVYYDVPVHVRTIAGIFYRASYLFYLLNRFILRVGSMLQGGNFIVRRNALNEIGGFNPDFSFYGEDTDLARRLAKVGAVKFSFDLPALSSGRRLTGEGLIRVGWNYSMNFIWATFRKRPYTNSWTDFRDEEPQPVLVAHGECGISRTG